MGVRHKIVLVKKKCSTQREINLHFGVLFFKRKIKRSSISIDEGRGEGGVLRIEEFPFLKVEFAIQET